MIKSTFALIHAKKRKKIINLKMVEIKTSTKQIFKKSHHFHLHNSHEKLP